MAPTVETMSFHARSPHNTTSDQTSYLSSNGDIEDSGLKSATHHRQKNLSGKTGSPVKDLRENETKYRMEFFKKERCLYSHQNFKHAAVIFHALQHEKLEDNPYLRRKQEERNKDKTPQIPHIDFDNAKDKRLAFELAFSALKFQYLLEKMLSDVSFFSQYPEHREEEASVMVILQDYQTRKFQQRSVLNGEKLEADIQLIEEAIMSCAVKLNASMARNRIKHQVVSIDHLLPVAVRETESKSLIPAYLWVNLFKTSVEAVTNALHNDGFIKVASNQELSGKMYCVDPHCDNVLTFSHEAREDIVTHNLVKEGCLVLQDKSSCYGPHSVKCLLNDSDDVIHINIGSGATTAHMASLLGKKSNHVWAFSNSQSEEETQRVKKLFEKLKVKNVKLIPDHFLDTSPDDTRLKNAKVVLISAECSKSGVSNPIDFVVSEGEDMTILKDLSIGETDHTKLAKLIANQGAVLKHAMRMSKVQAIIYCTRSVNEVENELAVQKAMEYANTALLRKVPYRVAPPVLMFSGDDIDGGKLLSGKFIKVAPSDKSNGCFVALITREPEEIKETAKDILDRAAAKGLLGPKSGKSGGKGNGESEEAEDGDAPAPKEVEHEKREKLLHRRVRKPQSRLSPTRINVPSHTSAPLMVTAKVQTRNVSYKASSGPVITQHRSPTRHVSIRTTESIVSRLYNPRHKTKSAAAKQKSHIQEYRKFVKHPAPFR